MSKLPAIQFYPGDWRKDPGVQALGFFERGVWFEILCILWESEERGKLLLNGKKMPEEALARLLGLETEKCKQILAKLVDYGVAKIEKETGIIYNARMVRDEELRKKRKQAGKLGGNPNLLKQKASKSPGRQSELDFRKRTPSSSSSVSFSTPVKEEDPRISEFLDRAKQSHKTLRASPLLIDPGKDRTRVVCLLESVSDLEQLTQAWLLFLKSEDPYLMHKPRNLAVFTGQVGNYLETAAKIIQTKRRRLRKPPVVTAPPDRAEKRQWQRVLRDIETEILPENFETWIDPLRFGGVHEGTALIYCPEEAIAKTVVENFSELLERRLSHTFRQPLKVQFLTDTS